MNFYIHILLYDERNQKDNSKKTEFKKEQSCGNDSKECDSINKTSICNVSALGNHTTVT